MDMRAGYAGNQVAQPRQSDEAGGKERITLQAANKVGARGDDSKGSIQDDTPDERQRGGDTGANPQLEEIWPTGTCPVGPLCGRSCRADGRKLTEQQQSPPRTGFDSDGCWRWQGSSGEGEPTQQSTP